MQDIASIGFSVDTSQLKKGQVELDKLAKSGVTAQNTIDEFGNKLRRADVNAGRFIDSAGRMREANGDFVNSLNRSTAAARDTTSSLINMTSVITALASSTAVSQIVQYSDAWTGAQNQLRMVTGSTEELADVTEELMKVANGTRSSFEATSTLYSRLARSTTELNLSQSDLLGLVTTINQSFATSGATVEEASAAITQLSQGLASGTLRGDEFNSVSEAAPGIMRAIADSLKMTTGELREFAAEGGITAEIVVNALKGAADSIENDFGKAVASFAGNIAEARNNLLEFVGTNETISSSVSGLGDSIVFLSENMDGLVAVGTVLASVYGVKVAGSLYAAAAARVANTNAAAAEAKAELADAAASEKEAVLNARNTAAILAQTEARVKNMRAIQLQFGITSGYQAARTALAKANQANIGAELAAAAATNRRTAAMAAATAGTGILTTATTALGRAVSFLGGPVGILAIAATSMYMYSEGATQAEYASKRVAKEVKNLSGAYKTLSEAQLVNEMTRLAIELQKVETKMSESKEASDAFANSVGLLGGVGVQTAKTAAAAGDAAKKHTALKAALESVGNQYKLLKKAKEEDEVVTTSSTKSTRDLTKSAKAYLESLKDEVAMFGKSSSEIKQYNALKVAATVAGTELATAIEAESEELARLTEEQEAAKVAAEEFKKAQAEAAKEAERLEREYERTFESISDNITDVIMDFESLGSVATSIAKQIASSFIQNKVVNPLLGGIGLPGAPTGGTGLFSSGAGGIGSLANSFAMSGMGQGLGLSTLGGAQLASQYGLTTGVASTASSLTGAGSLFTSAMPWLAGGLGVIGALAGMFKKPSDKTQSQALSLSTGNLTYSGLTGNKFSQDNLDAATAMSNSIASLVRVIESDTGQTLAGGVQSTVGGRDGVRILYSQLGIDTSLSKDMNEAAAEFVVSGSDATEVLNEAASKFAELAGFDLSPYESLLETTDSIGTGLEAIYTAGQFFGETLDQLEQSFRDNALEGETFEAAFGRAIQQASADMQEFIASINGTFSAIAGLSSFATSVREDMLADDELYKKLKGTADELGASILSLTDPDEITKAVNEYTALSQRAWGLLDESQRNRLGEEFASALESVRDDASRRTDELIEQETQNLSSAEAFSASAEAMAQNADKFTSAVDMFAEYVQELRSINFSQGTESTYAN